MVIGVLGDPKNVKVTLMEQIGLGILSLQDHCVMAADEKGDPNNVKDHSGDEDRWNWSPNNPQHHTVHGVPTVFRITLVTACHGGLQSSGLHW